MTEEEATEIVERYEALVTAVVGDCDRFGFDTPLEIIEGRVWATQTERQEPEGSWFPRLRSKLVQELPRI